MTVAIVTDSTACIPPEVAERLGSEGLMGLVTDALRSAPDAAGNGDPGGGAVDARLLDQIIEHVRELNGGDLDDDLAILALGYSAPVAR